MMPESRDLPPLTSVKPYVANFILRGMPSSEWRRAIEGARKTNPQIAAELEVAFVYLRQAAEWWRASINQAASDSGNAEAEIAEVDPGSSRPDSLDTAAVGRRLGVSARRVCQLIDAEILKATRVGRRSWAIDPDSVDEYLMRSTHERARSHRS